MDDQRKLARAIVDGGDHHEIVARLTSLLRASESENLTAMWHPLGFINISLVWDSTWPGGDRPRIHVWHPELSRPQFPQHVCHSHGWHLRSNVLHGRFVNETYEVSSDPRGDHALFEVSYGDGVSRARSVDEAVSVELVRADELAAGASYEIGSSTFHWTRQVNDDLIVTAMNGSGLGDDAPPPRNARKKPCEPEYSYIRSSCSRADKKRLYGDIVDCLEI
ncbi:hypothetical protein AB0H34_11370 [Saccharopolyspora shandongensis]|uniref:hypothetical protein n=1 Tax=Saccharopolyspora shandongensis TaxID=418495 RepID=UPI0033FA7292